MKSSFIIAFGIAVLAVTPFKASAQSPYSDTYFNNASLKKEAEAAKAQREAEEREYREALAASSTPVREEIKKPEDFNTYAEYREYLDGLGKRTSSKATNSSSVPQQTSSQTTASGTVVNNYYVNTEPSVQSVYVEYDPWWDLTMGLFFDPY